MTLQSAHKPDMTVFAVKTTGKFCQRNCKVLKIDDSEIFSSPKEALLWGFNPCPKCNPLILKPNTPEYISHLMQLIITHPDQKIKEFQLREMGIDPNKVRQWFQHHHRLSFQDVSRLIRINAKFGSFAYEEKATPVHPPKGTIYLTRFQTKIGPMMAAATDQGICMLEFMERRMLETQLHKIQSLYQATLQPGHSPYFSQLIEELNQYFEGSHTTFSIPLDYKGTPFQEMVWRALMDIPYGKTSTYQNQAITIGNPNAIRAVAKANGDNRIAILIPCHRVIGKNGDLIGYGGKIWRKEYLLKLEAGIMGDVIE
ncbi:MAG: methylated-DNA--[protein]-cysteine S-methyltransferase [Calditrichia bacterium]